jgi:hypothetical protein
VAERSGLDLEQAGAILAVLAVAVVVLVTAAVIAAALLRFLGQVVLALWARARR